MTEKKPVTKVQLQETYSYPEPEKFPRKETRAIGRASYISTGKDIARCQTGFTCCPEGLTGYF
ncbi:MAG: hypothetical protein ACQEP5_05780 [Actinomycetota bacterium]